MRPDASRIARAVAFAAALSTVASAGAQEAIPSGDGARAIAVNPVTRRIYVANEFSNDVTVVDGDSHATSTVAVGRRPQHIAVNAATNKVYVNNGADASISVIDGATHAVTTLPVGSTGPIAVDEAANKIYVARMGNTDEVTVIDGASHTWYTAAIESYGPVALALDGPARRLYVANHSTGDVRVVDLTSGSAYPPTTSVGVWSRPVALALDPATRRVFVIGEDSRGPIAIIEGATLAAKFAAPPGHAFGPVAIAANSRTGRAYAAFAGEVIAIDGASGATTFIPAWTGVGVAVDAQRNRIYVPAANGAMAIIDGASHAASHVTIPAGAKAIAVNPATGRVYVVGPGITAFEAGSSPPPAPPPPSAPAAQAHNVQGLWWASPAGSESGWGLNLAQQGDALFATWFTYDTDGSGMWLVMSNGRRVGANTWSGELQRTTGPVFNSVPFDPSRVARTTVGSMTLDFRDGHNGRMTATVSGIAVQKEITRQVYAGPVPTCVVGGAAGALPNYQDLWWAAPAGSESGWGLNVTHQGDVLFVTWFTYAPDGKGLWLAGSNVARTGHGTYAGALHRSTGPPFNASPWDPTRVSRTEVGHVQLSFGDAGNGVLSYTLGGVTQSRNITRQAFSTPASACR